MTAVPPFDPTKVGAAYVYVAMADHLTARMEAGEWPSGSRLPNERDLAAEYGVSVSTARRAARELRERGLVVTIRVKGTYVL